MHLLASTSIVGCVSWFVLSLYAWPPKEARHAQVFFFLRPKSALAPAAAEVHGVFF